MHTISSLLVTDDYIEKNKTLSFEQCGEEIQMIMPIMPKGLDGLEACKERCDNNSNCNAIEYAEEAVNEDNCCVLRKCPYPVPEPYLEQAIWHGGHYYYTGYVKSKHSPIHLGNR